MIWSFNHLLKNFKLEQKSFSINKFCWEVFWIIESGDSHSHDLLADRVDLCRPFMAINSVTFWFFTSEVNLLKSLIQIEKLKHFLSGTVPVPKSFNLLNLKKCFKLRFSFKFEISLWRKLLLEKQTFSSSALDWHYAPDINFNCQTLIELSH